MKNNFKLAVLFISMGLTACSSNFNPFSSNDRVPAGSAVAVSGETPAGTTEEGAVGGSVGGSVASGMDEFDRSKMFHALDKPVGKSSEWTNQTTNIHYTVTPTEKVEINGNPFCRKYTVSAQGGSTRAFNGTACVGADSNWQNV